MVPPVTTSMPTMVAMPPFQLDQSMIANSFSMSQMPIGGASVKIDSDEAPHPTPSFSTIVYETRQGKLVDPPPVCLLPHTLKWNREKI